MALGAGVIRVFVAGVVALACAGAPLATPAAAVTKAWPEPAPPPGVSYGGTIVVHGCQVSAQDLLVRARPIVPPDPIVPNQIGPGFAPTITPPSQLLAEIGGRASDGNQTKVVRVRAASTGVFEFMFDDLIPLTPYRLGVKLLGASRLRCDQVVWDVSRDPLIMAGTAPVNLEAYVVNSRLAVWGTPRGNRTEPAWVAADGIDFDDPVAALRQFRWRSIDPDVTGGRLQVSTEPFPHVGGRAFNPCSEDVSKIAYQHDFAAAPGNWAVVPVDFKAIVSGGRTATGTGILRSDEIGADPDGASAIDGNMRTRLELGHPLYVRVLSTRDGAPVCDPDKGVPAEALLAKILKQTADLVDQPQFEITEIVYDTPYIGARPKTGETCYRVTEDHYLLPPFYGGTVWDDMAIKHMSGVSAFQTATSVFPKNLFCVPAASDDDGWLESFVSDLGTVLTGLVDEIAKLVNSASELWEEIQDYAVKAVAAGLNVIPGINCPPQPCQAALEMGLEVALATMGVPPSIPNFDQLVDQGFDYAAAQVASQIGVPSALTDVASSEAQKFVKKAISDMQQRPYSIPKLPSWLVPDIRFNPAVLTLKIRRTTILPLPSRPGLIRDNDPIYAGRFVQLPAVMPGPNQTPIDYPMVLEPNLAGLPPAPASKCTAQEIQVIKNFGGAASVAALCNFTEYEAAVWDKDRWVELRYKNGCYHLRLTGLAPIGDHVFVLRDQYFRTEDVGPCQAK